MKLRIFLILAAISVTLAPNAMAEVVWHLSAGPELTDVPGLRRALALEMRELTLVDQIECETIPTSSPEIFISAQEQTVGSRQVLELRVWDRGLEVGKRRVALSGGPRLVARRAALAVAELVRNLNRSRKRALRSQEQSKKREAEERAKELAAEKERQLQLVGQAEFSHYLNGGWSAGPVLGLSIFRHQPLQIDLQFSWQSGQLTQLREASLGKTAPGLTLTEARLGLGWNFYQRGPWRLGTSMKMTYSVANMGAGVMTDGQNSRASWTSRAWGELSLSYAFKPALRTELAFLGGGLLRPIELSLNQQQARLSGALLGGAFKIYFGL